LTKDTEKAKVQKVFTGKAVLRQFEAPEISGKLWSKEGLSLVEQDQVREHLNKWDIH